MPYVYIYAIEKNPGSIDYIYNKIKEETGGKYIDEPRQSMLGCNDELIVLKDLPLEEFRKLYQDKTGILNHSNSVYQNYLIGLTTIIGKPNRDEDTSGKNLLNDKEGLKEENRICNSQTLSSVLREEFKKLDWIANEDCARCHNLKKDWYHVLNILQRFETTPFPDYLSQTLLLPLHVVKLIMEKVETEKEKDDVFASFYELFKGISLYAQNSIRSDRQFTQSLDYNIRIYQTPAKLNAFYNAYIYNLKEYLNSLEDIQDIPHKYEFIACPGITDNMCVQELFAFSEDSEKIFLVSIPENQMYSIRLMLVMLSHEVGHFVGKSIRNRPDRIGRIEKILARITARYCRISIPEDNKKEIPEEYWSGLENKLEICLKDYMALWEDKEYVKKKFMGITEAELDQLMENLAVRKEYSHTLSQLLLDSMDEMLFQEFDSLFAFLLETQFCRTLEKSGIEEAERRRKENKEAIRDLMHDWVKDSPWNRQMVVLSSVLELIIECFKECVADMIGIMTLRLSLSDYLKSILESAADQGHTNIGNIGNSKFMIRCAIVFLCMVRAENDSDFRWDKTQIKNVNKNDDCVKKLFKYIICFLKDRFHGLDEKLPDRNDYIKSAINVLYDPVVVYELANYLIDCRKKFVNYNNADIKRHSKRKKLIDIYNLLQMENAEMLLWEMQNYILEYQKIIEKEVMSLTKGEKHEQL